MTPLRVLFFEDDADDVSLALHILKSAQFDVTSDVSVTLDEFRQYVRTIRYDVILSDYWMPGATGMDCLAELKAAGQSVPFILVTGALGEEKAVECLKNGVEDYVLKDHIARLPVSVRRTLENRDAEETRRRAVAELDQFFGVSLDMLCICNLDGYIQRLNPAWERVLGFSPDELRSRPWIDFVHPEDRPQAEVSFQNMLSGTAIDHLELRFMTKSGAFRWLVGSATPALEMGVVFAAASDITDRKCLEEQLRSQNAALEEQTRRANEANRLKSDFLTSMSHELRSPLNGIIGFTELLYDGKLGQIQERPRQFLGRIHSSAMHLLDLINDVLDLSKVEAGRLELRPERVSVVSVIGEVTEILSPLASEKHIHLTTETDESIAQVVIDPGRLKQVLYNYLSNAIKFTGNGGRVAVRLKTEGSTDFRLEVSDTGIGIAEKDVGRLFLEFQQLDATTSKRHQGTGLGLALTKRVVEAQGGRVGVESELGQGSTFFAVLPRSPMMRFLPDATFLEPVASIETIQVGHE
ncbi:MAG TPA: ATP-binding protein [Bryobacteraceae bacterium]|nr:ATP-binding protein [Bryobacteraceae bacterium]